LNPGSAWNIAFDGGADVGCSVVHEGVHFVLLHLNDAHDVIPLDGDVIGSAVCNDDLAILVAVTADTIKKAKTPKKATGVKKRSILAKKPVRANKSKTGEKKTTNPVKRDKETEKVKAPKAKAEKKPKAEPDGQEEF
jgi:hypothetical protein